MKPLKNFLKNYINNPFFAVLCLSAIEIGVYRYYNNRGGDAMNKRDAARAAKENAEKTEIGIVFHPNYNDNEALRNARLVRVDVVIAECTPNYDNLDELFSWESINVKGEKNDALAQSIKNALQEVNPKGKAIYSYYIYTM